MCSKLFSLLPYTNVIIVLKSTFIITFLSFTLQGPNQTFRKNWMNLVAQRVTIIARAAVLSGRAEDPLQVPAF